MQQGWDSLSALVKDRFTGKVRQESLWTMIFTANIMICSESREQVYDGERRNESQVVQGGDTVREARMRWFRHVQRRGSGYVVDGLYKGWRGGAL